jgi:hypothetical protein
MRASIWLPYEGARPCRDWPADGGRKCGARNPYSKKAQRLKALQAPTLGMSMSPASQVTFGIISEVTVRARPAVTLLRLLKMAFSH